MSSFSNATPTPQNKQHFGAKAKDDGKSYGGAPILSEGYAGIRTDFMDVEFDDYAIRNI